MSQPELIVVDSVSAIKELAEYLADKEFVAYDCETTGLTKRHEVIGFSVCAAEDKAYYVILAKWSPEKQCLEYLEELREPAQQFIATLRSAKLIMHNGIFDCMMAEAYFGVPLIESLHTDTMVLAHLLNENRRVALKELSASMFGEDTTLEAKEMKESVANNGGSLTKDNYEMFKADAYLMAKYGAKDAWMTYKLFMELVPELYAQGLDQFFYEDESMPLLRGPTYDLNTTGIQVDTKALATLKKTLQAECLEAKAFIYQEIDAHIKEKFPGTNKKNGFNIGASQQLSWLLFGKLALEFGTLTKGGKAVCKALGFNKLPYTAAAKRDFIAICTREAGRFYTQPSILNGKKIAGKKFKEPWAYIACDKRTLQKLAPRYKWIEKLLEYQRKMKLLSTYVEGIEERTQYGVLQPSYLQHGTVTGRYSSRNPNLQNLPRDDQRVKNCFTARSNKVFVSADFSQLEPRIFSFYSKDPRLMQAFNGETDFYSVVGIDVYDKHDALPQKEGNAQAFGIKYKDLRDKSKTIALAAAYGATPGQLAPTMNKSIEDTAEDMRRYFERFPGVKVMMLEAHELVKSRGYVTNNFGRVRRIPEATSIARLYGNVDHWDLPYEARKMLNMACNFRIQSTGASIVNRACIRFHRDCTALGLNCKIVSQIHDEVVVECDETDKDTVSLLLQNAMEATTVLDGVGLEAIPRVSKTLAK